MHRHNPATRELWVVSKVGSISSLAERIEKNTILLQQYCGIAVGHDPSLKPPLLATSSAPSL